MFIVCLLHVLNYSFFVCSTFHWLLCITIACHCDLFSMPASFDPGNNILVNFPNNNISKGRWTPEQHKIFMQEYEKYGNNCMLIAKVLSTRTPAQLKKHAECFFKHNLKTNSAAVKRYQETLTPNKKEKVLVNDTDAHRKQCKSFPPEKKIKFLETDADAHKKK
jgi:hypothetical protein